MQRISPKKLTLHPEAGRVPEMPADQYAGFLDDVRERGIQKPVEVLPGTLTVVDGRTRLKAAREAGLPDVPVTEAQIPEKETPLLYMLRAAGMRRHLGTGPRAALAAEIAALWQNCQSNLTDGRTSAKREAAAQFNVSERTVRDAATVLEKGTDKEVEAVKKGDIAPSRAAKIIQDKEKDVRAAAEADPGRFGDLGQKLDDGVAVERVHKELRKREKEGTQKRHVLLDATDHPVPGHLRDIFGDLWLRQTIEMVESLARDGVAKVIPKVKGKGPAYTHMKSNKVLEALDRARTELEIAHSLLNESKPHAVHRACEGKGCKDCARAGWVPKWRWVELKAEGKL
jgi:hypothetical protein